MRQLAEDLCPGGRRDLLRVLTAPDHVRADVIRQFHERGDEDMVDLLVLLEEQEWSVKGVTLPRRARPSHANLTLSR